VSYTAHLDVVSREGGCGLSLVLNVVGSVIGCGATWAPASCVKKGEGKGGGRLLTLTLSVVHCRHVS